MLKKDLILQTKDCNDLVEKQKKKQSLLYKLVLITFTHAELRESNCNFEIIRDRLLLNKDLVIKKLLLTREPHQYSSIFPVSDEDKKAYPDYYDDSGYHYHCLFLHDGWPNRRFTHYLRDLFPEFDGRSLDISFCKSFAGMINYIVKTDPITFSCVKVQYGITFDELLSIVKSTRGEISYEEIYNILYEKTCWDDVLQDNRLKTHLVMRFSNLKNLFRDLQVAKENSIRSPSIVHLYKEDPITYLNSLNFSNAYPLSKFSSGQLAVMSWLYKNILQPRKERDDQLLVIGRSTTGKTKFIKSLLDSLDLLSYTYFANSEDFTGYQDKKYLLIFADEFNYKLFNRSFLLKLLAGSGDLSFTGKYKETNSMKENLPVILCCNSSELPDKNDISNEAFYKRVKVIKFDELVDKSVEFPFSNKESLRASFFLLGFSLYSSQIKVDITNINIDKLNVYFKA